MVWAVSAVPAGSRGPLVIGLIAGAVVWGTGVFGAYGWFTDELYFLSCADRPAPGYVDHPPLATLLLGVVRFLCQDRLALIRLVPVAAYIGSIVLVGWLARSLGGGAFAQSLASGILATAPAVLVIAGFYSMNPFELLLAIVLAQLAVALAGGASPRTWLVFGAVTGLALLNKHSALLPAGLLVAATLASPARAHLATRWPYVGAAVAVIVAAPNIIWLVAHDGITFEFYRTSVPLKNIEQTPLESIVGQAMFVGPMVFAIAIAGAIALARQPSRRGFAAMFAIALVIMMASGISRADRILAVYPLLFAAGACALERFTCGRAWRRVAVVATLAFGALPPLPLVLPLLSPPQVLRYSTALAVTPQLEIAKQGAMPQWLGDKRGWPEVVEATAAVVRTLSPDEQQRAILFGADYGIAGALELYGPGTGLHMPVILDAQRVLGVGAGCRARSDRGCGRPRRRLLEPPVRRRPAGRHGPLHRMPHRWYGDLDRAGRPPRARGAVARAEAVRVTYSAGNVTRSLAAVALAFVLASCSSFIEKRAASSTYEILRRGNVAARRLPDVELARAAAPGGIVQMAAFAAAYPKHRGFQELHAESLCQYAIGFVFDDWEAASLGGRPDDARRIATRLAGLLAACIDANLALLPAAWRAATDPARWTALLPSMKPAHVPFLLSIASAEAVRVALEPLAGVRLLDRVVATLARCIEVSPGLRDSEGEILLGTLLASRSRFVAGPNGEAQLAAARRQLGPTAILVDVMYARGIAVARQDRVMFLRLLDQALAADLSRWPERRLANEIARIKAERYRGAVDTLIPPPNASPW